jgi:flagellar basal-body rod protein FlgF
MNIGLYQSAASLTALERWQDAVAQNITASQVTGYKKRTVEFRGLAMGEVLTGKGSVEGQSGVLPKASYGINFQMGETHPTQRELDAAIQGDGFFQVRNSNGEIAYTRAGEFHITPERNLVTKDGSQVLTADGNPITLLQEGGRLAIGLDGVVSQGETQLGSLGIVRFLDSSKLVPVGGGMFKAPQGIPALPVEKPQVLQGHLEASNVTPLREMVALVQIARAYEANQKMIASRDQILDRTLQTLG